MVSSESRIKRQAKWYSPTRTYQTRSRTSRLQREFYSWATVPAEMPPATIWLRRRIHQRRRANTWSRSSRRTPPSCSSTTRIKETVTWTITIIASTNMPNQSIGPSKCSLRSWSSRTEYCRNSCHSMKTMVRSSSILPRITRQPNTKCLARIMDRSRRRDPMAEETIDTRSRQINCFRWVLNETWLRRLRRSASTEKARATAWTIRT